MEVQLPGRVRVEREVRGTRFVLPPRELKGIRGLGIGVLVFGLFITGFMVLWMWGPLHSGFSSKGGDRWFSLVFGLMGLPGLAVGLAILAAGFGIVTNCLHSEIVVDRDYLRASERVGPLGWTRRRRRKDIAKLVVSDATITSGSSSARAAVPLAVLRAEGAGMKPMTLAAAYPPATVQAVAAQLSQALGVATETPPEETVEEGEPEPRADLPIPPPPGTDIRLAAVPGGISITVPPAGLLRGSKGLFVFALLWNAFVAAFLAIVFGTGARKEVPVGALLVMLVFAAIGVSMLLSAVSMGRRQVMIGVVGGTLLVRRITPFGAKDLRLGTADVAAVRVAPSGVEVNNRPLMELQIHPRQGRKLGLLTERSDEEREWLASELRKALGVPANA